MALKSNPVRIHKVSSILQRALGDVFLIDTNKLFAKGGITVTALYLGADLGTAKVYLSFAIDGDKDNMLKKVVQHSSTIRKMLGIRIAGKMRKVPQLRFYIDNAFNNATRLHQLIDAL